MESTVANTRMNTFHKDNTCNFRYIGWICALFSVLILGRAWNSIFFYAFAMVGFLVFAMSSIKHCIPFLLFLLPISSILKPSVDSISFFTILFFITVLKMIVLDPKIDAKLLISLIVFFIYALLFSGAGEITTSVTIIAGILMLYYIRSIPININAAVLCFFLGICFSSSLALLKTSFPTISTFVNDSILKLGENNYTSRFSGLVGNPNYYTIDITVALSAVVVMLHNEKKISKLYSILAIVLSVFGLMSLSKSFLLSFVILIICWFGLSVRRGASRFLKCIFTAAIGAVVVYYIAHDEINAFLIRLRLDDTNSISGITTGRTDIWESYIQYILSNLRILFFGNGLNSVLEEVGRGTHNTYLESLFSLGLFGTAVLAISIRLAMGKITFRRGVWLPVVLLAIRMLAIGILTYDSLWFYLVLILLLSTSCQNLNRKH